MFLADVYARWFMHLCGIFWDPSCTEFIRPKFVLHHFVGRTMDNLQNMCYFINSHSSNRTMSRARSVLSSVMAVDGHPAALSCVIFMRPFFNFIQYIPRHSVAATHCSRIVGESLWWVAAPDTSSDYENRFTERCSSLVHRKSGAPMINGNAATMELT